MRREWSGLIRARQWSEFEKLAKSDPSQDLADTIAELELGFPEKPDRRALRKILFLLSQAGYEPREIESPEIIEPKTPFQVAFMVTPDSSGDTVVSFGREERNRIAWLIAHISNREGITKAIEDTTTIDECSARLRRMRNLSPLPSLCAEIPVPYALSRLAEAVSITKSIPPVMAYWRASLPLNPSVAHPGLLLPLKSTSERELRSLISELGPCSHWRLELGAMAPALEDFIEKYGKSVTQDQLKDSEWWDKVMSHHRDSIFSQSLVEDHVLRLLDVAYLLHLKGDPKSRNAIAIMDDLQKNGPTSVYAKWIAPKSLIILFETLRRNSASGNSGR